MITSYIRRYHAADFSLAIQAAETSCETYGRCFVCIQALYSRESGANGPCFSHEHNPVRTLQPSGMVQHCSEFFAWSNHFFV